MPEGWPEVNNPIYDPEEALKLEVTSALKRHPDSALATYLQVALEMYITNKENN